MNELLTNLEERNYQNRVVGLVENGSWAPVATKVMKAMMEKCKNLNYLENINDDDV